MAALAQADTVEPILAAVVAVVVERLTPVVEMAEAELLSSGMKFHDSYRFSKCT